MEVKMMKLSELKPYENNPRNNEGAVEYVASSITQFGFKVPIVVDKDNVIVAGHTRYKAAERLEMDEVPVIVADDLTPEQIKAFRLADNKVAEKSGWDYSKLGKEIEELLNIDLGFKLTDIGFGEFEISALTGDYEPEGFDEELVEEYSGNEQEFLEKKRVIITYEPEDEEKIAKMLGLDEVKKIVYDLSELL